MFSKFKKAIGDIYDFQGTPRLSIYYIVIAVVTMVISKKMGYSNIMVILISLTAVVAIGLILQLLKKEKSIKNISLYLYGTIFIAFITYMVRLINLYDINGDIKSTMNIIKIFVSGIVFMMDLLGLIYIISRENPKKNKITIAVILIYMTLIAIAAIIFLPTSI